MKFHDILKGLAHPWKTVIKQRLENELVVESTFAAYAYTYIGEIEHDAIRADPRVPIIPDRNLDFGAASSLVKATSDSFDSLVKEQDAIDMLSDEQKLEYVADPRYGNHLDVD